MVMVNAAVLTMLALLCVIGLFHSAFEDNTCQRLGMMGVVCWVVAELWSMHRGWEPPAYDTFQYVALLLYACGSGLCTIARHGQYGANHATEP